ncbi:13634_t:CDS:1 [Ambispora leptoticha]|uniref:13634_t:CDS:1 n=1 Tax=Ambispora leptoticha TaxID=144679 RepID=A0A9N8VV07_9GLOM|nr:13634_t:CDS:1 [Ambispora leptoticha]
MLDYSQPYFVEESDQLQQNTVFTPIFNNNLSPNLSLPIARASLTQRNNGIFIIVTIDNQPDITIEFPLPQTKDLVASCSKNQTRTGNAFLLFRSEFQRHAQRLLNNSDISSYAGSAWKNSDQHLKNSFTTLEKKLKEEFKKKHMPFIQYTPYSTTNRVKRGRMNKEKTHTSRPQRVIKDTQKTVIDAQNNSVLIQEPSCTDLLDFSNIPSFAFTENSDLFQSDPSLFFFPGLVSDINILPPNAPSINYNQ